jgi:uncharacterized protein (DUF2235 family)
MKRIVLCFDGTWNAVINPKTVTNVVRLANLVTVRGDDEVEQVTYYNSGVGSGGFIDRLIGGAFGAGLKGNVKRGIAFLALNYDEGDEIYLFGFSRGAYTARAVGGGDRCSRHSAGHQRDRGALAALPEARPAQIPGGALPEGFQRAQEVRR